MTKHGISLAIYAVLIALAPAVAAPSALAKDAAKVPKTPVELDPASSESGAERVNVDAIKEKYWARGNESEIGVVQNRTYSKEGKFELGVIGGMLSTDPFLSVQATGMSFGYHLSEYFAVHAVGWKSYSSPSSALDTLREGGKEANINPPYSYLGGELNASLLYGKLSLIGKAIIYYDLHLTGGAGLTTTESGKYFTPVLGIGQRFFLSKMISLRIDYRAMTYNETILEKTITSKLGQPVGTRTNWTNAITLGFEFMFGLK